MERFEVKKEEEEVSPLRPGNYFVGVHALEMTVKAGGDRGCERVGVRGCGCERVGVRGCGCERVWV